MLERTVYKSIQDAHSFEGFEGAFNLEGDFFKEYYTQIHHWTNKEYRFEQIKSMTDLSWVVVEGVEGVRSDTRFIYSRQMPLSVVTNVSDLVDKPDWYGTFQSLNPVEIHTYHISSHDFSPNVNDPSINSMLQQGWKMLGMPLNVDKFGKQRALWTNSIKSQTFVERRKGNFDLVVRPVRDFLQTYFDPYATVVITMRGGDVMTGEVSTTFDID
ncbi:MAG: hypothetical protein KAS32_31220 [Candidatus Peribacteraceae bacterium]|nr:hypothetical protein [Candidatus Peribacteraceae bacterium]